MTSGVGETAGDGGGEVPLPLQPNSKVVLRMTETTTPCWGLRTLIIIEMVLRKYNQPTGSTAKR